MTAIHQFVPFLNVGAVATHILEIQRTVRAMGRSSEVFAAETDLVHAERAHHYTGYGGEVPARDDDVLVYHLALGSPMATWLRSLSQQLVVDYHNVTPSEFFAGWHADLAAHAARGRRQLRQLSQRSAFALADSRFNEAEMHAAHYGQTAVVPILIDLDQLDSAPDPATLGRLQEAKAAGGADWLFVGRVAPNKAQHDIVKAFAAYRRAYDPRARLHLVGGPSPASYFDAVSSLVAEAGLTGAVTLTGSVTDRQIAAYYRSADVFVCLSEHEGFCVPLLEAWHHRLPVVAFAAAAVPETLGGAGLLLAEKHPSLVAAAVHRVTSDDRLREALVGAGRERLGRFSLERSRAALEGALERLDSAVGSAR
jgi:L-malate glycosyltransferase